jgi:hypothetical protein
MKRLLILLTAAISVPAVGHECPTADHHCATRAPAPQRNTGARMNLHLAALQLLIDRPWVRS